MATLKAMIFKERMRADKTWTVYIRFTHEKKVRYIGTTMHVTKKDLTSSMKIKNMDVVNKCDELILAYRKKIASLNLELNEIDIDAIVRYLKQKQDKTGPSFSEYADMWIAKAEIKGVKNYKSALNALKMFIGRKEIWFREITVRKMEEFEKSLKDRPRAQSLYTNSIIKIFNDGRDYYNDEDNGIILIKHSLRKYHAPRPNVAEKRALTTEALRHIFALPYESNSRDGRTSRRDLALDCFKLSFCLMGMNSVDLFTATKYDGEYITYNRTKTMDRRSDKAEMKVKVHPSIRGLVEKYKGTDGHVFNFAARYSTWVNFNKALNIGLKSVGNAVGVEGLQYYAARHSMATIALNEVGINKYIVNDMLCHTDPSMRVTDLYIKKDFTAVNEANFKLIEYVMKGKK